MLQETQEAEEIIERVAALDIGKAELMCCVRVPDEDRPGGGSGFQHGEHQLATPPGLLGHGRARSPRLRQAPRPNRSTGTTLWLD